MTPDLAVLADRLAMPLRYVADVFGFQRRLTREVRVGGVGIGGANPVRIQSMTTTDTLDTAATVAQSLRLARVGCEVVRITAPTIEDARNLGRIRDALRAAGCHVPLVADIHFSPAAALEAARHVEKVRINPGNFADSKRFAVREYSDTEYEAELGRIANRFSPLVETCKSGNVAMRIGTNHGSLSDRIMNRFGDTPLGMVESALEFAGICRSLGYHDIVFSMKASNPKVMVQAYRLLAARLDDRGWDYPFHLGVTEAGNGEDGRIKSAIGIGALLDDGIGDTIRVSLTEDPEAEVPVAFGLARRFESRPMFEGEPDLVDRRSPYAYTRHRTHAVAIGDARIGGSAAPAVVLDLAGHLSTVPDALGRMTAMAATDPESSPRPDVIVVEVACDADLAALGELQAAIVATSARLGLPAIGIIARLAAGADVGAASRLADAVMVASGEIDDAVTRAALVGAARPVVIETVASYSGTDATAAERARRAHEVLSRAGVRDVIIAVRASDEGAMVRVARALRGTLAEPAPPTWLIHDRDDAPDDVLLGASVALGAPLCDGFGDAVTPGGARTLGDGARTRLAFNVLQGAGARITKTEYVACPSCGRTLFDLQETTTRIQARTSHLKGVKIAIMGCIVNGPGEMADADFGYVGGAPERVNLYVGRECVEKGVPQSEADERLVDLIRRHGRWVEPLALLPV